LRKRKGFMRSEVRSRLAEVRERRMWTQGRLAEEAGVSPTTVSGIESGRILRPHFGTVKKLARALGVEPGELLSPVPVAEARGTAGRPQPLTLAWAVATREDEFEGAIEGAAFGDLLSLSRALHRETERLRRLYGEAMSQEQRRRLKTRIRSVTALYGSVEVTIAYHPDHPEP
jgi:transcriptional regulator with XRE-family HTH domain